MKTKLFPSSGITLLVIAIALVQAVQAAAPPAPTLVSPGDGSTMTVPTFAWTGAAGTDHYQIQVASDVGFTVIVWDQITYDQTITPINTLPNGLLYWRVRGRDSGGEAGAWTAAWSVSKAIPAPAAAFPADGAGRVITPTFRWAAADGATYYHVEVASNSGFTPTLWEQDTYGLAITPVSTLPNGLLYWRVKGMDADRHSGSYSATRSFTKVIPRPVASAPANFDTDVVVPQLSWNAVSGAAYYHVQVAANSAFTPVLWEEDTYNLSTTPVSTLPNGLLYWRVQGVDADRHAGDYSLRRRFTKAIAAPTLTDPADGAASVRVPEFAWQGTRGSTYYQIQVASDAAFTDVVWEAKTYNLNIVPTKVLPPGTLHWRVRGLDADGHPGAYSPRRSFTKAAPGGCASTSVELNAPTDGSDVAVDPHFGWTCMQGADRYRIRIYRGSSVYASAYTVYPSYTPYDALDQGTDKRTLPNGSYTWKVDAYDGTTVLFTSGADSFTKSATLDILGPADGSTLLADPGLTWQTVRGADRYRVLIYRGTSAYDTAMMEYPVYDVYDSSLVATDKDTLPNGTYTWKVEAYSGLGVTTLITTSEPMTFIKSTPFTLTFPDDASTQVTDPDLQWARVQGADRYRVLIYQGTSTYITAPTDYPSYTPYDAPSSGSDKQTLPNRAYTWKVEAYSGSGVLILTSPTRTFTKSAPLDLAAPADGATVTTDPTFQWQPMSEAHRYRLLIYKNNSLTDSVYTEYTTYTPYDDPGTGTDDQDLPDGTYTWKVEGYASSGTLLGTSPTRTVIVEK